MKKHFNSALVGALLSLGAAASTPAVADVISLRADEWCPYNCAPGDAKPGYMVEIAKKVFEAAGHPIDYQILNWARAIEETRAGKFTGIVGAAKGDAEDFVFPEEALGASINVFAVRKADTWTYDGIPSLSGRSLGAVRDYSYGDVIDKYIEANKGSATKIQVASGDNALEINLRKLQKGRLDTVVEGDYVLKYTLAKLGMDNDIKVAGADAEADPIYIAFSPANPKSQEYAALLTKGLAELRASGQLQEILGKYGLKDWK